MNHKEQLREFVVKTFLFGDGSSLDDDTSFLNSGIVDSTGILELMTFLESAYGVRVQPQEMTPENLDSVNRVARFLDGKLGRSSI